MSLHLVPDSRHRDDAFPLEPAWLDALWRMEERHYWHRARARWIARALAEVGATPEMAPSLLEIGCGSGSVAIRLQRAGYRVTGIDTAAVLLRRAEARCPEARWFQAELSQLPPRAAGPYDALGCFDVLEHLDDPLALLRAAQGLARPGAWFIASVPALRSLWSAVDELTGHKRRYEPGELAGLLTRAGLEETREWGLFRFTLPLQRTLARRRPRTATGLAPEACRELVQAHLRVPAAPIDLALGALCALECRSGWTRARGRAGASLLALGRVPAAR